MSMVPFHEYRRFVHAKKLRLRCSVVRDILMSIVDLKQVEHLFILTLDDLSLFMSLKYTMPCLSEVAIVNDVTHDMIERFKGHRFEQIRKLKMRVTQHYNHYITENIFYLFPYVKCLSCTNPFGNINNMVRFIDGFKYLQNAFFFVNSEFHGKTPNTDHGLSSIHRISWRLTKDNFTYRVSYPSK